MNCDEVGEENVNDIGEYIHIGRFKISLTTQKYQTFPYFQIFLKVYF